MSSNPELRALRKELLRLKAEQYRAASRQALGDIGSHLPFGGRSVLIEHILNLVAPILPGKWSRIASMSMSVWRSLRRVFPRDGRDA